MNEILKVEDLCMKIGKKTIFENINFIIKEGEIVGLLGHNGAGKSTIQRIIANINEPTFGTVYNCGVTQSIEYDLSNIVFIPDEVLLLKHLSIWDNYQLITKKRRADLAFFERYLKVARLSKEIKVSDLSKGNQEIIQIIILLSLDANIYLLDEPFSAIDIFRRELIQRIIIDLSSSREQCSIIITSHLIDEIEPILSRVLYLNDGNIELDKSIEEIYDTSPSLLDYIKEYFGQKVGYDYD